MNTGLSARLSVSLCGLLASAAGCGDIYQRHEPTGDAAPPADRVDAAIERLSGVDPVIRDAFDGRGITPGRVVPLSKDAGGISWPRGLSRLYANGDQLTLVGSGVRPGGGWSIPVLRFTANPDGTSSHRSLTWLSLGMGDYRPTEVSSARMGSSIVVCSRDHWRPSEPFDRRSHCAELVGLDSQPSFSRQWSEGRVNLIQVTDGAASGPLLLTGHHSAPIRWSLRALGAAGADAGTPMLQRELRCPTTRIQSRIQGSSAWVYWNAGETVECSPDEFSLGIERVDLTTGQDLLPRRHFNHAFGLTGADLANARPAEGLLALPDEDGGLAMFVTQQIGREQDLRSDVYLLRLYRDGSWGARKVDEGALASWALPMPNGGWALALSRTHPTSGDRSSDLLLLDANGRRLAPVTPFLSGLLISDLGYGLAPSGQGIWIVAASRLPDNTEQGTLLLRYIALTPPRS